MSVVIRLARFGKKNAPSYRLVAIPKRTSRQGRALEVLGYYNPQKPKDPLSLNRDRFKYWESKGALATPAVKKIIAGQHTDERTA